MRAFKLDVILDHVDRLEGWERAVPQENPRLCIWWKLDAHGYRQARLFCRAPDRGEPGYLGPIAP